MKYFVDLVFLSSCTRIRGNNLKASSSKNCAKFKKISETWTAAYHPHCDGLVECFNRTLQNMIATITTDHPFDWEEALPKVCIAYNTTIHSTTGYSPFYLMYGREPCLPVDIVYSTQSLSPDNSVQQSYKLMEQAYQGP